MRELLITVFLNFAGPVTLAAFLLWAHSVWETVRPRWQERKAEWRKSAAWALAGTLVAFLSTSVDFKVLSDETNLLSVANMLALFGKASNTEMWLYYYHTYHALDVSVPSRPILFPLLTALVHGLVGMRSWSPFVVNFACLFGLLFLAIEWGRVRLPAWGRALTWLALMMSPVLLIVSTSAGFDLSSLLFGFLAVLLLRRSLAGGERETRALILTLVCFASVRYESIAALPLVVAGLWLADRKRPIPWDLYLTAVILVLPLFVQRYLTWGTFENPPDTPPFSLRHMAQHGPAFLHSFFVDGRGPYPILLHWLGLAGLLSLLRRPRLQELLPLAYGAFLLVLLLSHHFGLAGHPTQVRLFLPLSFALSLLGLVFLAKVASKLDFRALLALFAVLFVHHHQYSVHDPLTTQLTMTREVRHIRDFLAEEGKAGDLHVYERPGQLTALGRSSVNWNYFRDNKMALIENLRKKLYQRIIVIEHVRYGGPPEETSLSRDGYRLTPLREHQLTPDFRLRISRLEWW
jgi:hypothetical protein